MKRRDVILSTICCLSLFGGVARAQVMNLAGYVVVQTAIPYAELEKKLVVAIASNKMVVVNRASASEGAAGRGVKINGDAVIGVFRNDFAVRMLAANVDAGIEAPIRLHLVEDGQGKTSIQYWQPSAVFSRYEGTAIKDIGQELDTVFNKIVAETIAP